MLKINVISSSSRGNCFILSDNKEDLMIDCGLKYDQIYKFVDKEKLKGVIISHSHGDHFNCNTLKTLNKCLYSNETTIRKANSFCGDKVVLKTNEIAKISGFNVLPFLVYHDVENYGYLIKHIKSNHKIVFITDSSTYSNLHFKDIDTFVVEANNSEKWVEDKEELDIKDKRTYGEFGHCSIEKTIEFLKENVNHNTKNIILIHIASHYKEYKKFANMVKEIFPKINVYAIDPQHIGKNEFILKEDIDIIFD